MKKEELVPGSMVYTTHAGNKMVDHLSEHGPYKLLKVTKGGCVMLEGWPHTDVAPRHILRVAS